VSRTTITAVRDQPVRSPGSLKPRYQPRPPSGQATIAGTALFVLLSSANCDREIFDDPDRFDAVRTNARRHLSFGSGIHRCPCANLARTEVRIALSALTARIPGMALAEGFTPVYIPEFFFHGLERLDVTW
jgi:cytochrome P450